MTVSAWLRLFTTIAPSTLLLPRLIGNFVFCAMVTGGWQDQAFKRKGIAMWKFQVFLIQQKHCAVHHFIYKSRVP
jgi:hypothetical protein